MVKGKPARGSWLVRAMASTVPDLRFNRSTLRVNTGLFSKPRFIHYVFCSILALRHETEP